MENCCLQRHLKGHEFSPEAQLYTRSSAHLRHAVVGLLRWFSIKENNRWLLIIDGLMTEALSSDDDVQTVKLDVQEGHKYDYALKLETLGIEQAESLIAEKNRKQWQVRCDRVKDGGRYVAYSSIELGPPDQIKESLNLLEKSPIAIKQAGAFIRETKSTISGYLQRYKSALVQLRQLGCVLETPLDTPPKEPVLVTTTISYDHISTEAETAAKFLKLWTYLDNRDLWYQLFTPDDPLLAQSESLWWFRWAIRTPEGFEKAMHTLKAYDRCYHLIVENAADPHFTLKNPFLPQGVKLHTAPVYTSAVSRLRQLYTSKKITSKANELLLRVSSGYSDILGAENDVTLKSIGSRAAVLAADGKLDEAESLFLQVEKGFSNTVGPNDPLTWRAGQNLSVVQQKLKRADLAEGTLRRVLNSVESTAGPGDSRTIRIVRALTEKMILGCFHEYEENSVSDVPMCLGLVVVVAELYQKQGKLDQAGHMFLQAVEGYERSPGNQQKEMADAAYNLATFYTFQGKLEDAEKMELKAIQGYNGAVGAGHHYTLDALNNLANKK
ncbi:hypothetical protein F5882DRAFT_461247 [Hyaloscypha sp. PMI_1271]|nr:hypothetical protein F5882DRAFT_461247 [Hyaloscypha sp. PMI_1271]